MSKNFQFIKDVRPDLYQLCYEAEKRAKTEPNGCVLKLRKALERFIKWICSINEIPIHNKDLHDLIVSAYRNGVIQNRYQSYCHEIRKLGNLQAHSDYEAGNVEQEQVPVNKAIDMVKKFHDTVKNYFEDNNLAENIANYDDDFIPLGDYLPIKVLEREAYEACEKKYLCLKYNPNTESNIKCIIRQFKKDFEKDLGFLLRDMYTLERRWYNEPVPQNIVKYNYISVQTDNTLIFTCYELSSNAEKLNRQLLQNLDTRTRLEIIRGIANGIYELHLNEEPIVHRYLMPASIYLIKMKDGRFIPKICNFEYAKIPNPSNETMGARVANRATDPFKAPESNNTDSNITWSKMDIYSLGVLVFYIMGLDITGIKKPARLKDCSLSNEFVNMVGKMISNNPCNRPEIQEVYHVVDKEVRVHG